MSVVDEIAALPGGQPLAELAALVQASPAAVRGLANRWSRAASDTEESTLAVGWAVSRVGQTWSGSSNAEFTDLMSEFGRASGATQQSLTNAAAMLHQAALAFEQAQTSIKTICENLLFQVSQVRIANPGAALEGHVNQQISALVGGSTEMARSVITVYESALDQAGTALSAEVPEFSTAFSALEQPGDPDTTDATGIRMLNRLHLTRAADNGNTVNEGFGTSASTVPVIETAAHATPSAESRAPAQVGAWINEAIEILVASGIPESQLNPEKIWLIIQHESSGDPSAVNNWDYNAAAGTPSIGLMQTIRPTFTAYALPDHGEITNPVDNIVAATRYALERYSSLDNVPGVVAVHNGQPYVGY